MEENSKKYAPTPAEIATVKQSMNYVFNNYKGQVLAALPPGVSVDRFQRIVRFAAMEENTAKEISKCTPQSFAAAVVSAALLGLEPGSKHGLCYFVRFKDQCNLLISYKGKIELARRAGHLISISANVVRKNDQFSYDLGTNCYVKHHMPLDGDRGEIIGAYAAAKLKNGGEQVYILTKSDIEEVKAAATTRSPNNKLPATWVKHEEAMIRKTAINRLMSLIPVSPVMIQMQETVEQINGHGATEYVDSDGVVHRPNDPDAESYIDVDDIDEAEEIAAISAD